MTVTIRTATVEDADDNYTLNLATIRNIYVTGGFAIPYPPEDLAAFQDAAYSPEAVRAELRDPRKATWIAARGDEMLGYAHVGPSKLPHPEVTPAAGELYQLYVREEAQGLGLGGRLLDTALEHLDHAFRGPIWLGVWSGNHRAQAIYAKLGFAHVGDYEFPVGAWRDREYIFRRN